MTTHFKILARPTNYEVAKMLADRDDAMRPYERVSIPQMEYPNKLDRESVGFWNIINREIKRDLP